MDVASYGINLSSEVIQLIRRTAQIGSTSIDELPNLPISRYGRHIRQASLAVYKPAASIREPQCNIDILRQLQDTARIELNGKPFQAAFAAQLLQQANRSEDVCSTSLDFWRDTAECSGCADPIAVLVALHLFFSEQQTKFQQKWEKKSLEPPDDHIEADLIEARSRAKPALHYENEEVEAYVLAERERMKHLEVSSAGEFGYFDLRIKIAHYKDETHLLQDGSLIIESLHDEAERMASEANRESCDEELVKSVPQKACAYCNAFVPLADLKAHETEVHVYRCSKDGCKLTFADAKSSRDHHTALHAVEYCCEDCDKNFLSENALLNHKQKSVSHLRLNKALSRAIKRMGLHFPGYKNDSHDPTSTVFLEPQPKFVQDRSRFYIYRNPLIDKAVKAVAALQKEAQVSAIYRDKVVIPRGMLPPITQIFPLPTHAPHCWPLSNNCSAFSQYSSVNQDKVMQQQPVVSDGTAACWTQQPAAYDDGAEPYSSTSSLKIRTEITQKMQTTMAVVLSDHGYASPNEDVYGVDFLVECDVNAALTDTVVFREPPRGGT